MVKPGGTGSPAFVISATPAPLPPSRSRIVALPSLKRYTHLRGDCATACSRECPVDVAMRACPPDLVSSSDPRARHGDALHGSTSASFACRGRSTLGGSPTRYTRGIATAASLRRTAFIIHSVSLAHESREGTVRAVCAARTVN